MVLELADLTKHYGGHTALRGFSAQFTPGRVHAIVGPNGAGKTTLLEAISGFCQVDAGAIHLDGVDITRMRPPQRARVGIHRQFQDVRLFRNLSVRDNLLAASRAGHGWLSQVGLGSLNGPAVESVARATELLAAWGLEGKADWLARSLSAGQQRIVAFLRAIMTDGRVLLLDEPSAGLAAGAVQQLGQTLDELAREGRTILLVEHDLAFVARVAHWAYVFADGMCVSQGEPGVMISELGSPLGLWAL